MKKIIIIFVTFSLNMLTAQDYNCNNIGNLVEHFQTVLGKQLPKKDEFETTKEYKKRVLNIDTNFMYSCFGRMKKSYNADNGLLILDIFPFQVNYNSGTYKDSAKYVDIFIDSYYKDEGFYKLKNSRGKSVKIEKKNKIVYILDDVKLNNAELSFQNINQKIFIKNALNSFNDSEDMSKVIYEDYILNTYSIHIEIPIDSKSVQEYYKNLHACLNFQLSNELYNHHFEDFGADSESITHYLENIYRIKGQLVGFTFYDNKTKKIIGELVFNK